MQVTSALIAAQQAAREAAAKLHAPRADFAAALDKASGEDGFAPLPLKQSAPAAARPATPMRPATRPGAQLDITI